MSGVSIKNLTRQNPKVLAVRQLANAFAKIAKEIVPGWDISLAFIGPTKARALNKQLRGKTYVPQVLSYIVGEKSGEIFICPSEATKQAPSYNLQPTTYILLLFIHGVLHIKGWAHSATMEECERKLLARFATGAVRDYPNVTTHSNRNRHRHLSNKGGRR